MTDPTTPPEPVEARDLTTPFSPKEVRVLRFHHRRRKNTVICDACERPWQCDVARLVDTITALRADTARVPDGLDVERLARAIAASLVKDGDIDLFSSDGEEYPNGLASGDIYQLAESVAAEYAALATSPEGGSDD